MRPQSIVRFKKLYLAKIVLGVIATLWGLNGVRNAAPGMAVILSSQLVVGALVVGLIGGLVIELVLLHLVVRRASDLARWIVVLFFAVSLVSLIFGIVKGTFFTLGSYPVSLLAFAISAGSVWFLFQPDAVRWFKGEAQSSTLDDRTS